MLHNIFVTKKRKIALLRAKSKIISKSIDTINDLNTKLRMKMPSENVVSTQF